MDTEADPSRHRRPLYEPIVTAIVVLCSVAFVISQLHPELIVQNTLANGGDMGAHVWAPDFLKHHLLPHGRITGWTPDWYAGFPLLTFYFPLPALLVALLSYVMPYAIAFKVVTVLGVSTLPISAWAFGRLSRMPFPAPACLAAATVPFLFDTGFSILGGNILSTLAGEYAFSIGLSLSIVFLGLVAGGLDTGRRRWLAALVFGAVVLTHILPTIFALAGGTLLLLMRLVRGGSIAGGADGEPKPAKVPSARWSSFALALGIAGGLLVVMWLVIGAEAAGFGLVGALLTALGGTTWCLSRSDPKGPKAWFRGGTRVIAFRWGLTVGVVGGLLSGFWALPFVVRSIFMNDLGWHKLGTGKKTGFVLYGTDVKHYSEALFPDKLSWLLLMAFAGAGLALFMGRKVGIFLTLYAAIIAIAFVLLPDGRLWNARLLPFWYLSLYMLAGLLVAELGMAVADELRRYRAAREFALGLRIGAPLLALVGVLSLCASQLPPPNWWPEQPTEANPSPGPWHSPYAEKSGPDKGKVTASLVPGWAQWNYSGYDGKDAKGNWAKYGHDEFYELLETMNDVGRQHGCGRAMWEYESHLDRFGSPMALMLLPKFTNGCIGSMEGLFFESSPTVPFHFLNQSWLSKGPSNPMSNLPYEPLNVAAGVTRLQLLGVRYYMALSPEAQTQASADTRLTLVATLPAAPLYETTANGTIADTTQRTWNIYLIAESDLVAPLTNLPAVMTSPGSVEQLLRPQSEPPKDHLSYRETWLENAVKWYKNESNFGVVLAESGPSDWPRITNADQFPQSIPVDPAKVTYIGASDDRISFSVDRVGVPVLVKASYFPNWQVSGAKGPYRVTPNLMVVIPTKNNVELHYGHTWVDWAGVAMTVLGLVGVVYLFRRERSLPALVPDPVDPLWARTAATDRGGEEAVETSSVNEEPAEEESSQTLKSSENTDPTNPSDSSIPADPSESADPVESVDPSEAKPSEVADPDGAEAQKPVEPEK